MGGATEISDHGSVGIVTLTVAFKFGVVVAVS